MKVLVSILDSLYRKMIATIPQRQWSKVIARLPGGRDQEKRGAALSGGSGGRAGRSVEC